MPGPAAPPTACPALGRRRLAKLTGTGLAQLKRIAPPPEAAWLVSRIASGTSMVPTVDVSIGFAVMRPRAAAVVSPK